MPSPTNITVLIVFNQANPKSNTIRGIFKKYIVSLGDHMTMKRTAGKHPKVGRVIAQDSAKGSPPENLVLPEATKAPKSPLDQKK